jgi:undecaprenyl-diphosphatase
MPAEIRRLNRALAAGFAAALLSLVLFGWIANQVARGRTLRFDDSVRAAVHAWASPAMTAAMRTITQFGSVPFVVAAGGLILWQLAAAGRKRAAWLLLIATLGAEALDQVLKLVFHRARPEAFFGYPEPVTYSFPSGHAITSASFYGVLAAITAVRLRRPIAKAAVWALAAFAALAIGISRIYLGVHYPSDVAAGYAAAVIWVGAVRAGYGLWLRRPARGGGREP